MIRNPEADGGARPGEADPGPSRGADAIRPSRTVDPGLLPLPWPPGGLVLPLLPGALCKSRDPDVWFPGRGESFAEAKAVCRACPVRVPCLEWAIQAGERTGVWGGTSPDERARLRQQRRHRAEQRAAG